MSIRENLHNYYEKLVSEALQKRFPDQDQDLDYLSDIACVALNNLPPRYFRHEIDMAFYLAPSEFAEMREKVAQAVEQAQSYVDKSLRDAAAAELARQEEARRYAEAAAQEEALQDEEEPASETETPATDATA